MIITLVRTSWMHILRMRYASAKVVCTLAALFLTLFFAVQVIGFLSTQKNILIEKMTYPLFLQEQFSLTHERVQSFISTIESELLTSKVQILSKEQALDTQIAQNPSVMDVLTGDNPLPDVLIIPLYGVKSEVFVRYLDLYADIFENHSTTIDVRQYLSSVANTVSQIQKVTAFVMVFFILAAFLMLLLLIMTIRSHLRHFKSEIVIGRLVGAEPYFFWVPYVFTMTIYIAISAIFSWAIFALFRFFV